MASEIRVDKINSLSGVGTVTLSPTGVDIAGITTAATLRATTGIVTSLTAGSLTSLGAVSGTTGTFSAAVSGTTGTFSAAVSGTTGTFTGDVDIADKIIHTGDTNTAIRFPAADTITAETGGSERLRIDSSGRLLIGQTSADADLGSQLQVAGSSYAAAGILQARTSANQYGPALDFLKSRNATWGSHTIVQDGDDLGRIYFRGDDGSDYGNAGAAIFGEVDGTPGSDDMPGRLTFYTSADGSVSLSERLRITSAGRVGINETSPDNMLHVRNDNSAAAKIGGEGGSAYYMFNYAIRHGMQC